MSLGNVLKCRAILISVSLSNEEKDLIRTFNSCKVGVCPMAPFALLHSWYKNGSAVASCAHISEFFAVTVPGIY